MGKSSSSLELGFIRLNRRKKRPLATQLYDEISRAILEGQLARGFRLPSTRGLATDLGISRTTVISAFDQLAAEGYLIGTVGKGTFVSDQLPEEHQMVHFQSPTPPTITKPVRTKPGTISISPLSSDNATESNPHKLKSIWQSKCYGAAIESNDIPFPNDREKLNPFTPGVPALDKFPLEVWARLVRRQWKKIKPDDLSYGSPSGYEPLRKAIAEYVRAFRGVKCEAEQVFMVAGTQQALDLATRLSIGPGDQVLFEDPGYPKAKMAFQTAGAKIVSVPIDESGCDVEFGIAQAPHARLAYVTPSHQFPMGVTLSIERRMKLIEWARQSGALIFEDDYDSEYRYSHRPIPSLQGLGDGEQTIYVGSFSKVVFPSLSMGYAVFPKCMVDVVAKSLSLLSRPPSTIDQMVLTDFIAEGHFARHLRRMRQIHHQRRTVLVDSVNRHLSKHLEIVGGEAGLHSAAVFKNRQDDYHISELLEKAGVVTRPLSSYAIRPQFATHGLILGFASATPARILSAVKKMAIVFERN